MAISPPSIRRLTREDPGGLALLRRHRRVTLLGAGAAVLLGLTGGALGYRLGAGAGAAVAITLAVLPLLLLFLWRIPLAYLTTTFLLLGLNCFAFLIDEALVYRGMAAVLLLLTIVRFGRLDLQRTGTYNACLLLMALAAAGHLVFHRSLWSAANIGLWLLPFFTFYAGYGLEREYGQRYHKSLMLGATLAAAGLLLVFFGEWAQGGFQFKSWVIDGPFLNGNASAAFLGTIYPLFFVMAGRPRMTQAVAGLGMSLAALWGLLVTVSRSALMMAVLTPVAFLTRRIRWVFPLALVGVLLVILYTQGLFALGETFATGNPQIDETLATFRIAQRSNDRLLIYGVAWYGGIVPNMLEGIGFGNATQFYISRGMEGFYSAHNSFLQIWLEGGLLLLVPFVLTNLYILGTMGRAFFSGQHWRDPLTYALGLGLFNMLLYDQFNSGQYNVALKGVAYLFLGILAARLAQPAGSTPAEEPGR